LNSITLDRFTLRALPPLETILLRVHSPQLASSSQLSHSKSLILGDAVEQDIGPRKFSISVIQHGMMLRTSAQTVLHPHGLGMKLQLQRKHAGHATVYDMDGVKYVGQQRPALGVGAQVLQGPEVPNAGGGQVDDGFEAVEGHGHVSRDEVGAVRVYVENVHHVEENGVYSGIEVDLVSLVQLQVGFVHGPCRYAAFFTCEEGAGLVDLEHTVLVADTSTVSAWPIIYAPGTLLVKGFAFKADVDDVSLSIIGGGKSPDDISELKR
jgi:hypothetical protein